MRKKIVLKILTISALIVAFPLFLLSCMAVLNFLSNLNNSKFLLLISMLLGICGYIGLIMSLINNKKAEIFTLVMLFLGILGVVFFISIGGEKAWKWILTFEEPGEALLLLYPVLISIVLFIDKGIQHKLSMQETTKI